MKNGEQPAYPEIKNSSFRDGSIKSVYSEGGLTKRELIAAMAMQGMMANSVDNNQGFQPYSFTPYPEIAKCAVQMADALILELDSPQP